MRTEDKYDWLFEDSHQEDIIEPIEEPIEEPKPTNSDELKVGDKVRILQNPEGIPSPNYVGQTGTIIREDGNSVPFFIRMENGDTWWYRKDFVEPFNKLKVGDKVCIKSREWYEANKNQYGEVDVYCTFTKDMAEYCGKVYEIVSINRGQKHPIYKLKGADSWSFSEEMFVLD